MSHMQNHPGDPSGALLTNINAPFSPPHPESGSLIGPGSSIETPQALDTAKKCATKKAGKMRPGSSNTARWCLFHEIAGLLFAYLAFRNICA